MVTWRHTSPLYGWPVLKAEKHLINCYTTQSDVQLIFSRIIVFVIYSKDTQKELNCPMWGNPDSGLGKNTLVACKSFLLQFGILGFGIGNAAQRTRIPITITIRNPNSTEKESDKNLRFPFMGRKKGLQACPGKQRFLVWVRRENRAWEKLGNSLLPTHLYLLTRLFAVSYLSLENLIPNHWLTTMKAPIVLLTKHALNKQPFHRSYLHIEGAKKFTLDKKKKYEKIKGYEQCTCEKQVFISIHQY